MKKNKVIIILYILLIIAIALLIFVFVKDIYQSYKTEEINNSVLEKLEQEIKINNQENTTEIKDSQVNNNSTVINNYTVYGKIEISSVGIKYPILEYNDQTLKNSICTLLNKPIDGTGNLCLAGHNTSNGTLFGKLKKVKSGDIVKITNINGEIFRYKIYNITVVQPNDNSLLAFIDNSIVTLITCTNSAKQRLVVQGELINE